MAVLTANRPVPNVLQEYASGIGYIINAQVGVTEEIYQGSFTTLDSGDKYLAALTVPDAFYGLSLDRVTGGAANGDVTCRVLCEGVIQQALASVAVADIGKPVFASDDQVLTLTGAGTNTPVGVLVGVPATGTAIVKCFPPRIEIVNDWTVTNWTDDSGSFDADGVVSIIGDALGTLVNELILTGVISGTVSA